MKKDYVSVIYDDKRTPRSEYPSRLASYLAKRFSLARGAKVLEVGCGRGDLLKEFHALGFDCRGLDASDHCARNMPELKVVCADLSKERFPYDDNSFDIIYHKSVLEHFNSPDHIMKETARVLRPGGRVIVLTPDWVSQMKVFYEDFTHSRPYDTRAIADLLAIYGFSGVTSELFYQLPVLWDRPYFKVLSGLLRMVLPVRAARRLTEVTKIKFFRWSVELMVLGTGINEK